MGNIVGQKIRDYRELMRLDNPVKNSTTPVGVFIEDRLWEDHKTIIKMQQMPVTLLDATSGGGVWLCNLPLGWVGIFGAACRDIRITTTSVLAATLNASVVLGVGVGTALQSTGTLATTQQNLVNVFAATSSAVINVPGTAPSNAVTAGAAANFNGTVTPVPVYFNIGVPTATDIDADATVLVDGEVEINFKMLGSLIRND